MWKCPVCQHSSEGLLCGNCGFDDSRNFEKYPTLGKFTARVQAISAMYATWQNTHQNKIQCSCCGDRRFLLDRAEASILCFSCGAPLPEEQWIPFFREKSPKALSGLKVPPEGCQVVAVGCGGDESCQVDDWQQIVAISVSNFHTVGLKQDGTVIAVGDNGHEECETGNWTGIQGISAAFFCSYGIKQNGTLTSTGTALLQNKIKKWRNIRFLTTCEFDLFGLTEDGHVLTTNHFCKAAENWRNIISLASGYDYCVGLQADGTVKLAGSNQMLEKLHVQDWQNITTVAAGHYHTVGLRRDGTVVATGDNQYGQCDVGAWKNIVAIATGEDVTAGLRADGTVVCTNWKLDVSGWKRIAAIAVSYLHIVGLQLSEEQYRAQRPE